MAGKRSCLCLLSAPPASAKTTLPGYCIRILMGAIWICRSTSSAVPAPESTTWWLVPLRHPACQHKSLRSHRHQAPKPTPLRQCRSWSSSLSENSCYNLTCSFDLTKPALAMIAVGTTVLRFIPDDLELKLETNAHSNKVHLITPGWRNWQTLRT